MFESIWRTAIVVLFVQLVWMGPGWAEEMTFGEEEVSDEDSEEADEYNEMLDEGKKLYDEGDYEEASLVLYDVVSADSPEAEATVAEAEYELAKSLVRMELYQGAISFYGNIVDEGGSHPYFKPALRGLVVMTDEIPGESELLKQLSAYVDYYPEDVPEEYREQYAYLVGNYLYRQMDSDPALDLLTSIDSDSEYFGKARYIAGVTHVSEYEAEPAVDQFKQVLEHLRDKDDRTTLSAEEQRLLELTTLAMGRVFYSTGDYETSIKYYGSIDRESQRWPNALFEESWARFQTDEYNHALGNLHSLNSPFFADSYFPEGPILSAVIFFYNCNYDRVRQVLDDFEYYYEPLRDEVSALLDEQDGSTAMYEWLEEREEGGSGNFDPQLAQIVNTALDDAQVERKFKLVEIIEEEKETINAMPDSWQSHDLGSTLLQESELASSYAVDEAGGLARDRLERVVDELDDLITQQQEILFEVAKAEKGEVESDIRAGMNVEGDIEEADDLDVEDDEMYWSFDGEYWRDELGSYVYNINSECSR